MIRKEDLIDGCIYLGYCRNADEAVWDKTQDCFLIKEYLKGSRSVFGWTEIKHINDEENSRLDAFVPKELKYKAGRKK